jgi:hypothetical protein
MALSRQQPRRGGHWRSRRSFARAAACVAAVKTIKTIEGLESKRCAWASLGGELGGSLADG